MWMVIGWWFATCVIFVMFRNARRPHIQGKVLTLHPMGKLLIFLSLFQQLQAWFYTNCTLIITGQPLKKFIFYVNLKSKMIASHIAKFNSGHYGNMNIFFFKNKKKKKGWLNAICIWMLTGWSLTKGKILCGYKI